MSYDIACLWCYDDHSCHDNHMINKKYGFCVDLEYIEMCSSQSWSLSEGRHISSDVCDAICSLLN